LRENVLTFDLKPEDENNFSYTVDINSEELKNFELYDVYLRATYNDGKSNNLRINKDSIITNHSNSNKMRLIATSVGNVSLFTQNFTKQFQISPDKNKMVISITNKEEIRKNLKMLVRKESTRELTYFELNNSKTAFELEWKYFLDPRSEYSLFLTTYNNKGQIKKNIRLKEMYLNNFIEEHMTVDNNLKLKIFKNRNGFIKMKTF
jgi:hypothetical protein